MADAKALEWDLAQFRFTVKSPEGKDVKVLMIPWPLPAGAFTSVGLKNPSWVRSTPGQGTRLNTGDQTEMRVEAPGHDGKKVSFIVEQRVGGSWMQLKTVMGLVRNGVATAKWTAEHPESGAKHPPAILRFRTRMPVAS
jgi:hypothetical protein